MALSSFLPSVSGMTTQSHALNQVASNIANVNTVGYKSNKTLFQSLLGSHPTVKGNDVGVSSSHADTHGVQAYDRTNILQGGEIHYTGNNYDVAISGKDNAFFTLKDYTGADYFSRAGDFKTNTENGIVYLVNSGGMKVQGFPSLEGKDVYGVSPEDIIIKYPEELPPTPTTEMTITANVPATEADKAAYALNIYSANNNGETVNMVFTKDPQAFNTWNVAFKSEKGTITASETKVSFSDKGQLLSPKHLTIDVNWDNGDTNKVNVDISNMTQLAGGIGTTYIEQDGTRSGQFVKSYIDKDGVVKAAYDNGHTYNFAKLTLTSFSSPENLIPISGTLFKAGAASGDTAFIDNGGAIASQALENSAVNIEQEFSDMIMVQRAYSLNTQSFSTNNEMLELLIDLKS